jgi:toxin ParE1/3/4
VTRRRWTVGLADRAEADFEEIVRWTVDRFGAGQAASYGKLLAASLNRLERGPAVVGARQRDEMGAGLHTLHVRRRGRHIILFRIGSETERTIDLSGILHDAMDLALQVQLAE